MTISLVNGFSLLSENEPFFKSQYKQDQFLYEKFFKEKRNGIFVDIGAHNGVTLSNTYFFEKKMNWSGICIEPIPEVFKALKKNRTAKCVQGCICSGRDTTQFLQITGYNNMLSGILDKYSKEHMERIKRESEYWACSEKIITVKCYDLTKLLVENNIFHVDYLSLDTEGGELEILKSINFDLIDIKTISVENNYNSEEFQLFLKSVGFKKIKNLGCDEIYCKSDLQ